MKLSYFDPIEGDSNSNSLLESIFALMLKISPGEAPKKMFSDRNLIFEFLFRVGGRKFPFKWLLGRGDSVDNPYLYVM